MRNNGTPPKKSPRDVTIETLAVVIARLRRPDAIDDLERKQIAVALEHAMEHAAAIQELKIARRKPKEEVTTP